MSLNDKRTRDRQDATMDRVSRAQEPPPTRLKAQVCRTVAMPGGGPYPTLPNRFYGVQPLRVTGDEEEGGSVNFDDRTEPFVAAHIGANAPPLGSRVVVFLVDQCGHVFEF